MALVSPDCGNQGPNLTCFGDGSKIHDVVADQTGKGIGRAALASINSRGLKYGLGLPGPWTRAPVFSLLGHPTKANVITFEGNNVVVEFLSRS